MTPEQAILLAIIQGITEWLPISSSGHLLLFQNLFNIKTTLFFNLSLHLGSVLALLVVFREDIKKLTTAFFTKNREYQKLASLIILAIAMTSIIVFLFQKIFQKLFANMLFLGIGFLLTGILIFLTKFVKEKKQKVNLFDAILIGIVQGFSSLLAGFSRSGSTISLALLRKINRAQAVQFSFLLLIPTIIVAFILEMYKGVEIVESPLLILVSILITFVISLFTLRFFLAILKKGKFYYFAYYCLILGIIVIMLSL